MSLIPNAVSPPADPVKPTPAAAPKSALGDESTFLTLLVSQLKNQDPLSPADTGQFVQQLTSYSSLEQLININKNTAPSASTTTTTTAGS